MDKRVEVREDAGRYMVRFPYSPQCIERLKDLVPAEDREWSKEMGCWIITDEEAMPSVYHLLNLFFP